MFGSPTLEAILGLLLTYVILSWCCAVLNELTAGMLGLRARYLEVGLRNLLSSPNLVTRFYEHPLVKVLHVGNQRPSYLPARTFALTLIDIIAPSPSEAPATSPSQYYTNTAQAYGGSRLRDLDTLRAEALSSADSSTIDVVRACAVLIDEADGNFDRFRGNVEGWFEGAMEQVSGMYKRSTFMRLMLISLVMAAALNADTVNIARTLAQDLLLSRVSAAASPMDTNPVQTPYATPTEPDRYATVGRSGLPLGWAPLGRLDDPRTFPLTPSGWVQKILGLLVTALALTLGATFWFDVLNKFIFVRTAFKPRESPPGGPALDRPPSQTEVKVYSDYSNRP